MELDRSPGRFFDITIQAAIRRSRDSAAEARRLLASEFPGPAYVWAVRSIEIFIKEVMLLPVFLEEIEGEPDDFDRVWTDSWKQVRECFRNDRWDAALCKVQDAYGALDPLPLTDDGEDVWSVWKSRIVRRRGDTVHGRPTDEGDPTPPEAELVVEWAEQMMTQLTLRLTLTTHPLHDLFAATFERARQAYQDEQGHGPTGNSHPITPRA
jgi:hypothetical protein